MGFFRNVKSAVSTCCPPYFRKNCIYHALPCPVFEEHKERKKEKNPEGISHSWRQERSVLRALQAGVVQGTFSPALLGPGSP